jgi:two-component system, LytTR family, response regulator
MTIRTVIIDDESLARRAIALLLASQPDFLVVGECKNGEEALATLRVIKPDLIFLDFQMPGLNGLELLSSIQPIEMPAIIFLTAHREHALSAFSYHALDYLLKPIDEERFVAAITHARETIEARKTLRSLGVAGVSPPETQPAATVAPERLVVKERGKLLFVLVDEIDWIEAIGDYTGLHVGRHVHLLREPIAALARRLDARRFVRIHRSAIVQLHCVAAFRSRTNRDGTVELKSGTELRVSRTYISALRAMLAPQTFTAQP